MKYIYSLCFVALFALPHIQATPEQDAICSQNYGTCRQGSVLETIFSANLGILSDKATPEVLDTLCNGGVEVVKSCLSATINDATGDCGMLFKMFDAYDKMCSNYDDLVEHLECSSNAKDTSEDGNTLQACLFNTLTKHYGENEIPQARTLVDLLQIATNCASADVMKTCLQPLYKSGCKDKDFIEFIIDNWTSTLNPEVSQCEFN